MNKTFIAIGGGAIPNWEFNNKTNQETRYDTREIDQYVVSTCNKEQPSMLFIGTAMEDNEVYYGAIKGIYEPLGCKVEELPLVKQTMEQEEIKRKIEQADIIYIGGGDTKKMMKVWENYHINEYIQQAYHAGKMMVGYSAGAYAGFAYNYELTKGLGIVPSVVCAHFDRKDIEKKNQFYENIKQTHRVGYAIENGVAIAFGENGCQVIKGKEAANAYEISWEEGEAKVTKLS